VASASYFGRYPTSLLAKARLSDLVLNHRCSVERVKGIEPSPSAWKKGFAGSSIPRHRAKTDRAHQVHLSAAALEIYRGSAAGCHT